MDSKEDKVADFGICKSKKKACKGTVEDSKGCGVNMMTEKQIEAIKRIFDKCIEVNKKGRAEVFFDWHPHTSQVDVSIHVPNWNMNKKCKSMIFYYARLDIEYDYPSMDLYKLNTIEKELDKYI